MYTLINKVFIFAVIMAAAIGADGCFMPWFGKGSGEIQKISVFDRKEFLEVEEYEFPEYKWNNNAKFAEELYAKAMADYFFTQQYDKALELFQSAKKVCPKDARLYVRMVESYARMGNYAQALDVLKEADNELRGFGRIEGIEDYRTQLTNQLQLREQAVNKPSRPLWKKILFAPAKLWPF